MKKLSTNKKEELGAHISSFSFSGFNAHFSRDMTRYKSFIGRDFKLLAQLAVHLSSPCMDGGEKEVWLELSKVNSGNTCNSYMYVYNMCLQVFRIAIVSHSTQRWLDCRVRYVLLLFKHTFLVCKGN